MIFALPSEPDSIWSLPTPSARRRNGTSSLPLGEEPSSLPPVSAKRSVLNVAFCKAGAHVYLVELLSAGRVMSPCT